MLNTSLSSFTYLSLYFLYSPLSFWFKVTLVSYCLSIPVPFTRLLTSSLLLSSPLNPYRSFLSLTLSTFILSKPTLVYPLHTFRSRPPLYIPLSQAPATFLLWPLASSLSFYKFSSSTILSYHLPLLSKFIHVYQTLLCPLSLYSFPSRSLFTPSTASLLSFPS